MMSATFDKENLSPSTTASSPIKTSVTSPVRTRSKGRSKSIGSDAVLDDSETIVPTKDDRRKSLFTIPVKSILPSKDDEANRRAARRKSLANRRVSFAPEATLHTWDVFEHMKEVTTSSTGSERSKGASHVESDDDATSDSIVPSTPDSAQKSPRTRKSRNSRRRSSAIPPLNFNDPDDIYSSSPAVESSPGPNVGGKDDESHGEEDEDEEELEEDQEDEEEDVNDDDDASMVSENNTENLTSRSLASTSSTGSNARLDANLRQAAQHAGTRGIEYDEFGYHSAEDEEEQNGEEVDQSTAWEQNANMLTPMAKNLIKLQEQENINPFSPAFRTQIGIKDRALSIIEENDGDTSMDMTRPLGVLRTNNITHVSTEDATMEFTQIFHASPVKTALKRRRSTAENGSPMTIVESDERPNKRRRSGLDQWTADPDAMDFTAVIGGIQVAETMDETEKMEDATMEFTKAIGGILASASPSNTQRRRSSRNRRSSVISMVSNEQTMDFTVAFGSMQGKASPMKPANTNSSNDVQGDQVVVPDEEDSMEMTAVLGELPKANIVFTAELNSLRNSPKKMTPIKTSTGPVLLDSAKHSSSQRLFTPEPKHNVGPSSRGPRTRSSKSPSTVMESATKRLTPVRLSRTPEAHQVPRLQSPTHSQAPEVRLTPTAMSSSTPAKDDKQESNVEISNPDGQILPTITSSLASPLRSPQRLTPLRQLGQEQTATLASPQKNLMESIFAMSSPRKGSETPRGKITAQATPVKINNESPMRTPRVQFASEPKIAAEASQTRSGRKQPLAKKIGLDDFLQVAGIKFMDLTATKRRYTAVPTPSKMRRANMAQEAEEADDDGLFRESVVAGACTLPELQIYQHSCRELKRYIAEGKTFLKQLATEVETEMPEFIQEYILGDANQRMVLDQRMTDMRNRARLQSKEVWYNWRSDLLQGLQDALRNTEGELENDGVELSRREALIDELLPFATNQKQGLEQELERLQQIAAEQSEEDKEALDKARSQLVELDANVMEQRATLQQLQDDLDEQERLAEEYVEGKVEVEAAITEASRMREVCRGISTDEALAFKENVISLEASTGWKVASASGNNLTMTFCDTLNLFFHPQAFKSSSSPIKVQTPSKSPRKISNAPISLTYIDTESGSSLSSTKRRHDKGTLLTTERRFFLQLIRAQLHCLDQSQTSAKHMIQFISKAWTLANQISETIRRISLQHPTNVNILSDEKLGIQVEILLSKVETKVLLNIDLSCCISPFDLDLSTDVECRARVVYGEQYNESKMTEFMTARVGKNDMDGAEGAVVELRIKLEKQGRKSIMPFPSSNH